MLVSLVLAALAGLAASQGNGSRWQCSGMTERKEVREMFADGDFGAFVTAFKEMAVDGSLRDLINIHVNQWSHAHFTPYVFLNYTANLCIPQ